MSLCVFHKLNSVVKERGEDAVLARWPRGRRVWRTFRLGTGFSGKKFPLSIAVCLLRESVSACVCTCVCVWGKEEGGRKQEQQQHERGQ